MSVCANRGDEPVGFFTSCWSACASTACLCATEVRETTPEPPDHAIEPAPSWPHLIGGAS